MQANNLHLTKENEQRDDLTGLLNLNGALQHIQHHSQDNDGGYSVIVYLNVMNFKSFNQQYGFVGGNEYLRGIAGEIQSIFSGDEIARTGGDQFIILSKKLTADSIPEKLEQVRTAAHKYERALTMHIKAGIYISDGNEPDPVIMIDRAKIACDAIIKVYDKFENFYDDDLKKRNDLRQYVIDNFAKAFEQHYFKVYYQKEVRALTEKVCGYEALARWMDPVYGMISPAIFVGVLEDVHLIHKLDLYMIEQVCRELRDDIDYGMAVVPISVNLSQLDFELCDIKAEVDRCRAKYDIPPYLLNIEITESAIASGETFLNDQINRFREEGYQVWMDDFGAGYSSLNNLKTYDFDVLKIDMNFLRSFDTNKRSKVILATIINMAKELGMHTLAEGVETREQFEFLRRIGCEKMQGYLFGKPKPFEDFVRPDEFTFEHCEDVKYKAYYRSIGAINVLGNTPLRDKNMDVFNNLPIALLELTDSTSTALYVNEAYKMFLSSLGVKGTDAEYSRIEFAGMSDFKKLRSAARSAELSPSKRSEVDFVVNGSLVNTKIRFIAREGEKVACALVSRNMSLNSDENKLAENVQVAMAHVFNQYFRVDLYDDNGTVENVFLNSAQIPVADEEPNAVRAVQRYSNMYLFPEERERFRKFYDIPSVLDRVKEKGADYIVDYYHSAIPGDNGRMQMYMILPFNYNGSWKYISCCRYADEINDELKYGKYGTS